MWLANNSGYSKILQSLMALSVLMAMITICNNVLLGV